MGEQLPLTDSFATEEENNIINNNHDWVIPMPVDSPLPLAVAQEETRPHKQTDQLVLTTPHSTQHLFPLTPMRERRRVLLEDILPFPVQTTTHHGGHSYMLVCPPLPRNGGAGMWLHQAEMVCGCVVASPIRYEEGNELVCGGVGWGRTAQSLPHQTGNTTGPSSVVWNNLGAMYTQPHAAHHYMPHLSPRETTTPNAPVAVNAHFSHKCHSSVEGECTSQSGIPREAVGDPPPTQQLVPGRMASTHPFDND